MVKLGGTLLLVAMLAPATVLAQDGKGIEGTVEHRGQWSIKDVSPTPQPLPPGYPLSLPNPHPHGDAFRQYSV